MSISMQTLRRKVRNSRAAWRSELGQSMTEFLVVLGGLILPLMFFIPVLAQMISTRQYTEQAARYGAWERTVWHTSTPEIDPDDTSYVNNQNTERDDTTIARQIDQFVYSSGKSEIYTIDDNPSHSSPALSNLTLQPFELVFKPDLNVNNRLVPMLQSYGNDASGNPMYTRQSSTNTPDTRGLNALVSKLLVDVMGPFTQFDLDGLGLIKSNVSVDLIPFDWLWDSSLLPQLSYSRSNVIFTDAWNPGGRRHETYLVQGLMPEFWILQALGQPMDNAGIICSSLNTIAGQAVVPFYQDIACYDSSNGNGYLDFGHVDVDPVPEYRLSSY